MHKAILKTGEKVAIKILKPNIEKQFAKDISCLSILAKLCDKFIFSKTKIKAKEIVCNFEENIRIELNLLLEASAASELKSNNSLKYVYIPNIYWQLSTTKILTSEWIDGISIFDVTKLSSMRFPLQEIAYSFSIMFFEQACNNGFFHADLHPGNVLINSEGKIVLLDFGIMGRLSYRNKVFVAEILNGFISKDYYKIARLYVDSGYLKKSKDLYLFAQYLRAVGEPIVGLPVSKISVANLLSKLFDLAKEFEIPVEPQLIALQKTLILVEGTVYKLNPEANIWELAEPWIKKWAFKNISVEAKIKNKFKNLFKGMINDFNNNE